MFAAIGLNTNKSGEFIKFIISDPVQWAASAVGTKARFTVTFFLFALLVGMAVYVASQFGIQSAVAIVLSIVWMQYLAFSVLRTMYLQAAKTKASVRKDVA